MITRDHLRQGTILIIVAGISALLASLALAFLARQRSSQQETIWFEQDVQARLMLTAACSYIAECSRIGYDTVVGPNHIEAFGWIDVRDGSVGPNTRGTRAADIVPLFDETRLVERWGSGSADRPAWPAPKSVARCPMHVLERPPFAIGLNATPNAIMADESDPAFGRPYLKNPDPQPQADTRADFMSADRRVRPSSANRAWFRVYREGPATFVITCGSGGTHGYRDWDEVQGAGATAVAEFGDVSFFNSMRMQETRLWYRVEWSPAIATAEVHNIKNAWNQTNEDHYVSYPLNTSNSAINPRSQAQCRNLGGTFSYIQRLRVPPTWW
jgi:hypothetical protein